MSLQTTHPSYAEMRPEWDKMRDCFKGERRIKAEGAKYLPPTKGMRLDGYGQATPANGINVGQEAYEAYKLRAVFPDYVRDAVEVFIGLLHSQPPQIELPPQLEYMKENATTKGESLDLLLRRINVEQLTTGRVGLLLDLPVNPDPSKPQPKFALYAAEAVVNWDAGDIQEADDRLNLVVLDESGYRREEFKWVWRNKFRVLELTPPALPNPDDVNNINVKFGPYRQGVFETGGGVPSYVESSMTPPMLRGQTLDKIPFVFINPSDLTANPDEPPLSGLANICLTIYRGEADYRQNLFLQGQDTLVIIGDFKSSKTSDPNQLQPSRGNVLNDDEPLRTGAGSMIHLEAGENASAEYIGVNSSGLTEQREALANDRLRAEAKAGALADNNSSNVNVESGEALKTRVAARTASLNQIARTGAAGLEYELRIAAEWVGANPDTVKVTPNLEFADVEMTGQNLAQIMAAKVAGAPLSRESIHDLMAQGKLTTKTWEEEKAELDAEAAEAVPPGTDAGGNPPDPNAPPQNQPPTGRPAPGKPAQGGRPPVGKPAA